MQVTGIDIGGTKCAVLTGCESGIKRKIRFETTTYEETLARIFDAIDELGVGECIGISCGGPLDSDRGVIMSPPNLPGWNDVHIVEMMRERYHVPTFLCNDANACALAEWKFGAGKGAKNMVFLTFGTGMGAGLILDGKLYTGTCGLAGEVGHMRMREEGPIGFGKAGSFEGFCSGGGIARSGIAIIRRKLQEGISLPYCRCEDDLNNINARVLAEYALQGEPVACEVYRVCGEMLGRGLAIIIDIINPEIVVIGSIFERSEGLLREHMERTLREEAIMQSLEVCRIVPAVLRDSIGDYAAITVAIEGLKNSEV